MAKKKSAKKSTISKEFSNSPFKSLKGLSASDPPAAEEGKNSTGKSSTPASHGDGDEIQSTFAAEMDFLGVDPLPGRSAAVSDQNIPSAAKPTRALALDNEDKVFLDAVGSMETVFKDEWTEMDSLNKALPRRMRQVEKGQLVPDDEVDLHGMTVDEAAAKVRSFLQNSVYMGLSTVLLITGKGLHSDDGPVLRQATEKLLGQCRELVIEWGAAPRKYGGEGALVVFLRQPAAKK